MLSDAVYRRLGDKADNTEERVRSTVSYVQKLDQEYLDQIFEAARWVFHQDRGAAFEVRCMPYMFSYN